MQAIHDQRSRLASPATTEESRGSRRAHVAARRQVFPRSTPACNGRSGPAPTHVTAQWSSSPCHRSPPATTTAKGAGGRRQEATTTTAAAAASYPQNRRRRRRKGSVRWRRRDRKKQPITSNTLGAYRTNRVRQVPQCRSSMAAAHRKQLNVRSAPELIDNSI